MSNKSIQLKDISGNKYYVHPYYPIGAIYLSVSDTNPSQWFGGTWELIAQGRTLVGVDTTQTEFNTVKKTGGEKTHVLTVAELSSHTHTFTGNSHTHSVGAHSHGLNSHTHTYSKSATTSGSTTLTIDQIPSHTHNISSPFYKFSELTYGVHGDVFKGDKWQESGYDTKATGGGKGHTHSITLSSTNSGAASGSTANSSAFNTGGTTQGGTNANTGSGTAHNNLQPYFTCYIWCRTS